MTISSYGNWASSCGEAAELVLNQGPEGRAWQTADRSEPEELDMSKALGRVLLVDDDPEDLKYYGLMLGACGYEVLRCASYPQSLLHLAQEVFDCVVVSQGSLAFEGKVVVEHAIERDRQLPVVVLARCLQMKSYLEAMQLGAVDYLEKPVTPEQIEWVLGTHVQRRILAA